MKEARYKALIGEQLTWTRHTDMKFGECPIAKDEIVRVTWTHNNFTCPPQRAGGINWGHFHLNERNPVLHYETCEPRFPELAKETLAKQNGSQVIGEFLEHLQEKGLVIAEWEGPQSLRVSQRGSCTMGLIHSFYGIDSKKAEAERQTLLDEFVNLQQGNAQ
jgi:hypothetical protein